MSGEEGQSETKTLIPKWAFVLRDAYLEILEEKNNKNGPIAES
jgi:hypothetical protein